MNTVRQEIVYFRNVLPKGQTCIHEQLSNAGPWNQT